jgi:DNA-binding XRE family transcriptional regulator
MEDEQYIESQLVDFGARLNALRGSRGWTLEELSERSGLSKPFLSRLEAGERQPSIAAVLTLARVFGVSVGSMFEAPANRESCVVVRGDGLATRTSNGLTYASLSSAARFANLQPMKLTVSRNRKGEEQYQHDGEEWVYVLSGRLRITVAGQNHELEPGDAAHFDSRQPHRLTALGNKDAELILVACPLPETSAHVPDPPARVRQRRAIS